MSQTNNIVFTALKIISWIIFVGLCIETGGLIVNCIFSIFKPEMVKNLYQKLDLSALYKDNRWAFFRVYSFILTIAILKVHLFYIVIRLMHKMDLEKPFSTFVARQITLLSYYTISIGLVSYIARQSPHSGLETDNLNQFWEDSQAFILMGAVIYIIATIFKQGLKLQAENDLTV